MTDVTLIDRDWKQRRPSDQEAWCMFAAAALPELMRDTMSLIKDCSDEQRIREAKGLDLLGAASFADNMLAEYRKRWPEKKA